MSKSITPAQEKKIIFNAKDVAARAMAEKEAGLAAGRDEWWTNCFTFQFSGFRSGANSTLWGSLIYKSAEGLEGPLFLRVNGERHSSRIMPTTDAGVAEMTTKNKNPLFKIEKRTKKPTIQITKYNSKVATADDGITLLVGADGKPILPGPEKRSAYYMVAELVNEAFSAEVEKRINRGQDLVAKISEMRRANKAVTAQAIWDAFNASQKVVRAPGDIIMATETANNSIRKVFNAPGDAELLLKYCTITGNIKLASLTQEFISSTSKTNKGCRLPNPITRIGMTFDQQTGIAQMQFFDKLKPYTENGKSKFEVGKVEGQPVVDSNIHKFVLSGSRVDGVIALDSICFSSMGISMPVKAEILIVEQPVEISFDVDDVYDDEGNNLAVPAAAAPAAAPVVTTAASSSSSTSTSSTTVTPPAAANGEGDYEDLIGELSGDAK